MPAKPNFIVIGSMKSGTTTLCHLLGQHRGVFMSTLFGKQAVKVMRENTPLGSAGRMIPASLKNLVKTRLEIQVDSRPSWDKKLRRWVIDEIADDMRAFLSFYGKPVDFWDMR